MQLLKQNTGQLVMVGPLVDATDGFTAETGVTLSTCSLAAIYKHNATVSTTISMRSFTHMAVGEYTLSLGNSDLDTLGVMTLVLVCPNVCRPFRQEFMVVPANVYDSLVSGSDYLDANVAQVDGNAAAGLLTSTNSLKADVTRIAGTAANATNLGAAASGMVRGTVGSGSTQTSIVTDLTEPDNDFYNGRTIQFTSGALLGQISTVEDYVGATGTLTVTALTDAPVNGVTFILL